MTIINYQFCVGGVCGAGCLPLTSRLTGKALGCHTHGEHVLTLATQWPVTEQPPTRVSGLWCRLLLVLFGLV